MGKEDLFGSIDISELAESESGIIESTKTPIVKTVDKVDKTEKEEKEIKLDLENTVSVEDLEEDENSSLNDDNLTQEEKDKKSKTLTPANGGNAPSSQTLTSLASVLHEAGVFSDTNEEELKGIKNVEDLTKVIEKQIRSNEYKDLTTEQKEYLEATRNGVPHGVYAERKSNAEQYKKIGDDAIKDEENIALRAELIKRSFIIKGIPPETAAKHAQRAVQDEDGGIAEAIEARGLLVNHEETLLKNEIKSKTEAKEAKLKDEQAKLDGLKSKINEQSEILPGIKINSRSKEKIFDSMTTPTSNKEGVLMNEVMEKYNSDMEYKMKLHALDYLTKGFTDFSKFTNMAKSKAVLELEEQLKTGSNGGGLGSHAGSHKEIMGDRTTSRKIVEALPDFNKRRF